MQSIDPKSIPVAKVQSLLLGGVSPRPIALVSTVSKNGINNLSPFSWFNAASSNPPTVVISTARRIRDGSFKDTYQNLVDTRECVIHSVTFYMVQQVSLASTEYPPEIDEFIKSGLTPIPSEVVKAQRVQESPFHMECVVKQIIELGDGPGSGILFVCEVVRFHLDERISENGVIKPQLSDLVARSSANYYIRASGNAVFEVAKPIDRRGMGFDKLPDYLKQSHILTANNLAQLANCESIPSLEESREFLKGFPNLPYNEEAFAEAMSDDDYKTMLSMSLSDNGSERIERTIRTALSKSDVTFAWYVAVYLGTLQ
jgi:flavin reductase (DIM6/NTAB) family NADH-FMN oxidoreductase RutF